MEQILDFSVDLDVTLLDGVVERSQNPSDPLVSATGKHVHQFIRQFVHSFINQQSTHDLRDTYAN
jgi:hypothetical protein